MLGLLRIPYDAPGATIALLENVNNSGFPRLVHIEHLETVEKAADTLAGLANGAPVAMILSSVTELLPTGQKDVTANRMKQATSGLQAAEYVVGPATLVSHADGGVLHQLPAGSVLTEASCLAAAFRATYREQMEQFTQICHLHLSEKQVDLFVYDRGELIHYATEVPEHDDPVDFESAISLLLCDGEGMWKTHIDLLVVSGACRWFRANRLDWLDASFQIDFVETFRSDYLFQAQLISSEAQRDFFRPESYLSATAIPVLLAGAAISVFSHHGGDFRKILQSKPQTSPLGKLSGAAAFAARMFGQTQEKASRFQYLGAYAGVFIMVACVLGHSYALHAKENKLKDTMALEMNRAEANRTIKQEAEQFKNLLSALNRRVEIVNKLRKSQGMNYQISNLIRYQTPQGIVLTLLKIEGRTVTITGYVSVENAAQAAPTPAPPPTPSPTATPIGNPAVDVVDPVTVFVRNLSGSGTQFANIQSNYTRKAADKSEFIVTCNYTGDVVSEEITAQPIPVLVKQASGGK